MGDINKHTQKWLFLFLGICTLITLGLYAKSLEYPYLLNYDDDLLVVESPLVQQESLSLQALFTTPVFGLYHPATTFSFWLENQLFGNNPFVHRTVNLLLHLANAWLLLWLLLKLKLNGITCAMAVSLFLLHPSRVESVAWISERKDVLYVFFSLWSTIAMLIHLESKRAFWYVLGLAFLIMALLSKATAVMLPFFLLYLYYFHLASGWRKSLSLVPFFILSGLVAFITILIQQESGFIRSFEGNFNLLDKLLLPIYGLGYYLFSFLPINQFSPKHFYPTSSSFWFVASLCLISILAVIVVWYKYRNLKWLNLGLWLFLLFLIPHLKIIPIGNDLVSDRYLYLPLAGIGLIIGQLLALKINIKWGYAGAGIFVVVNAFSTYHYLPVWQNEKSLWQYVLAQNPRHAIAHNELGRAYLSDKNLSLAEKHFEIAIQMDTNLADAYNNLGRLHFERNNPKLALQYFEKSVTKNESLHPAMENMATAYNALNQPEKALEALNKLPAKANKSPNFYAAAGIANAMIGNFDASEKHLTAGLQQYPQHLGLQQNYVLLMWRTNRISSAIKYVQGSEISNPDLFITLLQAMFESGVTNELLTQVSPLIQRYQSNGQVQFLIGNAYAQRSNFSMACNHWQRAQQIGYTIPDDRMERFCFSQ